MPDKKRINSEDNLFGIRIVHKLLSDITFTANKMFPLYKLSMIL